MSIQRKFLITFLLVLVCIFYWFYSVNLVSAGTFDVTYDFDAFNLGSSTASQDVNFDIFGSPSGNTCGNIILSPFAGSQVPSLGFATSTDNKHIACEYHLDDAVYNYSYGFDLIIYESGWIAPFNFGYTADGSTFPSSQQFMQIFHDGSHFEFTTLLNSALSIREEITEFADLYTFGDSMFIRIEVEQYQMRLSINNSYWSAWYGVDDSTVLGDSLFWTANKTMNFVVDDICDETCLPIYLNIEQWYEKETGFDFSPNIEFAPNQNCLFDSFDCRVGILYNENAIGGVAHLVYDNATSSYIDVAISSTTLELNLFLQDNLSVPNPGIATNTDFCVYYENADLGDQLFCGIHYSFISSSTFESIFTDYDINTACGSMDKPATSTFLSIDEIIYGAECAFRKTVFWLLTPRPESVDDFKNTVAIMDNTFPYNIYNGIVNRINGYLATSTNSSELVVFNIEGTDTITIISKEKLLNSPLYPIHEKLYQFMEIILWGILILYIVYDLINLSGRDDS